MSRHPKDSVNVMELSRILKIPHAFLRRILQLLSKKKILYSQKGRGGGFCLQKMPREIFVIDVITYFQGELSFTNCILGKVLCDNHKNCPLRRKIREIEKMATSQLKNITIASLLEK